PMLATARAAGLRASWHEIPADGPVPAPEPTTGPAIVTVFRLLLNVPEQVRDRAIAFAARVLPTHTCGLLIVENHGSANSLRRLGRRRRAGQPWFAELSHAQVVDLLGRHGFTVVERHGFGVLPAGAYRLRVLRPFVRRLD